MSSTDDLSLEHVGFSGDVVDIKLYRRGRLFKDVVHEAVQEEKNRLLLAGSPDGPNIGDIVKSIVYRVVEVLQRSGADLTSEDRLLIEHQITELLQESPVALAVLAKPPQINVKPSRQDNPARVYYIGDYIGLKRECTSAFAGLPKEKMPLTITDLDRYKNGFGLVSSARVPKIGEPGDVSTIWSPYPLGADGEGFVCSMGVIDSRRIGDDRSPLLVNSLEGDGVILRRPAKWKYSLEPEQILV